MEQAVVLAAEHVKKPQQVEFVQQPEFQLHHGLPQGELSRVEFRGVRVRLLCVDAVIDAEQIGAFVGRAQGIQPVDALLIADEARLLEPAVLVDILGDDGFLITGTLHPRLGVAQQILLPDQYGLCL